MEQIILKMLEINSVKKFEFYSASQLSRVTVWTGIY